MTRLFDDFASHYDETMLEKLGYRAHLHCETWPPSCLRGLSALARARSRSGRVLLEMPSRIWSVAGRLDGIDIATR